MDKLTLDKANEFKKEIQKLESDIKSVQQAKRLSYQSANGYVSYSIFPSKEEDDDCLYDIITLYVLGDLQKRLSNKKAELRNL